MGFPRIIYFLFALCATSGLYASDNIWGALVVDGTAPVTRRMPDAVRALEPVLRERLGVGEMDYIAEKSRPIAEGGEAWLRPDGEFSCRVRCLSRGEASYRLAVELFRGSESLLSGEFQLARAQPLIFCGPRSNSGRFAFILGIR